MNGASPSPRVDSIGEPSRADAAFDRAWQLYKRQIARCHTENQSNRLHTTIENYLTPDEVRRFETALAGLPHDAPGRIWIGKLIDDMPLNKIRPVEFERRSFGKSISLYTADAVPAAGKTLIIGFTGHYHRLMAPTTYWLDCLNPEKYDLLVLRDFKRMHYAQGIPGLGDNYFEALSNLSRVVDQTAYRTVFVLGTSGGGMAALLAAIQLKASRGIAFGSSSFEQLVAKLQEMGLDPAPFEALLASRPRPFPELILAYGAKLPRDAIAAQAVHRRLPTQLHPTQDCATHSLVGWHLRRRLLPQFLPTVFQQSLESGEPATAAAANHSARIS